MPETPNKSENAQSGRRTNGWDACIKLIDALYNLANSGNIIGLMLFGVIVLTFFIIHKLSPDQLNGHLLFMSNILRHEKYYIFPLSTALAFSIVVICVQHRILKKEISRLTEERSQLMHGILSGKLKPIENHQSSEFDLNSQ